MPARSLFPTLGLYVHVPFCARRCPYCDFAVTPNARPQQITDYVAALRAELKGALRRHTATDARPISTVFFGGGTPTELSPADLAGLMDLVRDGADLASDAEVTIEGNPETLDAAKLAGLRDAGFNRLSLGAQSFDDTALQSLGRQHRSYDIVRVVAEARAAAWENLSLDLIYAVPGQARAAWQETLQRALELEPEHVSCYALTIEEGTPFGRRVESGTLLPMADDAHADLMADADAALGSAGLGRYEISNWARSGLESRHNQNYWRGGDYLAAGCGAHGHLGGLRWWNERDTQKYIDTIESEGTARSGEEVLSARQRWNEIVMLGVRTKEGFAPAASRQFGLDARAEWNGALSRLVEQGVVNDDGDRLVLTDGAFAVADAVAARLLV